MNPKYKIGEKLWTINGANGGYVEQCTIESIDTKDTRSTEPNYKMVEGCSYWRWENSLFISKEEAETKLKILQKESERRRILGEKSDEFWESIPIGKHLGDGIYDVTDIPFYQTSDDEKADHIDEIKLFIESNPKYVIAQAYETYDIFILGKKPKKITTSIGSGFNYGSTNIIQNCPKTILILAEND